MQSRIEKALELAYGPIGIILTDEKPAEARQFKEGKWGCVMFMVSAAAKGETAVFDRLTYGCQGGGTGLGFGNRYVDFPGGVDGFCYFLSVGNDRWEQGREMAEQVKPYLRKEAFDDFMFGERYKKTPELVKKFVENLPIVDVPQKYVVFKPLSAVDREREMPSVVLFLGDMDQISALTILANYNRETSDNVIFPYAAGCMSIGIYSFQEARSERPRAVLGLNDISARVALKRLLKKDVMSFSVPLSLFEEMEKNVSGSFLERNTWKELMRLRK